jgi:hypothetical protein
MKDKGMRNEGTYAFPQSSYVDELGANIAV